MKERQILFSAPMVRAILAGTKTQTRRVVKPQPPITTTGVSTWHHPDDDTKGAHFWSWGPDPKKPVLDYIQPDWALPCPYGQTGDRLWVRESFCPIYPQDPHYNGGWPIEYDYQATYKHGDRLGDLIGVKKKWTPSIHMPRRASRITLEVTGVRMERLQDISIEDCKSEGAWGPDESIVGKVAKHFGIDILAANPYLAYRMIWESINGPGSWEANPWVWVVEFKRLEGGTA